MKKIMIVLFLTAAFAFLFAAGGIAAEQKMEGQQQQAVQQEQEQSRYAQQLMTPDKIDGMRVQNQQAEQIGTVDKVVLDSDSGQIAYVVITSGGYWGMGGEKAVIPWNAVKIDPGQELGPQVGGIEKGPRQFRPVMVLNVSKEQLKNAPQGEIQETLDRRQAEEIHRYYGVSPYWEGQQEQQRMQQERPMMQQQREHQPMQQQQQEEEKKRMQ